MPPLNAQEPPSRPPLQLEDCGYQKIEGTTAPSPAPLEQPPFTLKEIRDAVPPHCFVRSMTRSMAYAGFDLLKLGLTLWLGITIEPLIPDILLLKIILWLGYWALMMGVMGSIAVMGHECLHGAFSDSETVNDMMGTLLHSTILIPFHNWKISHKRHHTHSGHMQDEENYVPPTRSAIDTSIVRQLEDSPLFNFLSLCTGPILWMPLYLIYNFGGPTKYYGVNVNHFDPEATHFVPSHWPKLVSSNVAVGIVLMTLLGWGWVYGVAHVMFFYGIPYFMMNASFVLLSYLHHTDVYLPHYRDEEWNYMRSALATVDRSYGVVFDHFSHYINPTHVVHHLFPSMPFYHCTEATEAIKTVLGKYYLRDETPILKAIWRATFHCRFVEDEGGIVFYKKNVKEKAKCD